MEAHEEGRNIWDASVHLSVAAQALHSAQEITAPYELNTLDLTLFVSCYNEESSITHTLDTVLDAMSNLDFTYEIIIIDDASRDGSTERVREYIDAHPDISMVLRANRRRHGLAHNYIDAAFLGKGTYFRLIYGNSTETMETMVDILGGLKTADILVPYHIESMHNSVRGETLARVYAGVLNRLTSHRLRDYTIPAVHLRYNITRWHGGAYGYGFQVDLLCRLMDMGFTYSQMPCRSVELRPTRYSKLRIIGNYLCVAQTVLDILLRRLAARMNG